VNFYLQKYGFLPPQIESIPPDDLGIVVVIPSYNEPNLILALQALEDCDKTQVKVEVIIVVNSSEVESSEVKSQNLISIAEFSKWNQGKQLYFHLIHLSDLPKKHAGVGLARKIGMDEAVARFDQLDKDGIIASFDADAICEKNYLTEIERHFNESPNSPACSIYFEHPLDGDEFDHIIYQGIINYELHLRYYNQAIKFCGLPYAFHTVGSSMAVRSSAYQKQGGMNKRKAGEDFYFIHKIIALGNYSELNSTVVKPSPRTSDRVPFGTGKAISDWIKKEEDKFVTYKFEIFVQIKSFLQLIPEIYQNKSFPDGVLSTAFIKFLAANDFENKILEILENTTDFKSFKKRFFVWFDAFKVLKLVHYLRDNGLGEGEILLESQNLLNHIAPMIKAKTEFEMLELFRDIDRSMLKVSPSKHN
jgi:glycosyltransferase involved in cell wall biosynthesis